MMFYLDEGIDIPCADLARVNDPIGSRLEDFRPKIAKHTA
jgi:hypothetical protein